MTRYIEVSPDEPDLTVLSDAAKVLREGGLVAFPTETVYGLAAAASIPEAVERLRFVKNRPEGKPFSYLLADVAFVPLLVDEVPSRAQALMNRYWPGPLTLVLSQNQAAPETVGVRVPSSKLAQTILRLAEVLVLVPSANPSGKAPATSAGEVREYFDGKIDLVVDAGPATLKEPSTVVRVTEGGCEILRTGIITPEMVHQLASGKTIVFVCTGNTCRSPMAEALFSKYLAGKLGKRVDELPELGYHITSAGTFAGWGSRASDGSLEAMKERGCEISTHISKPVTLELLREADRIYTMTASQRDVLQRLDPVSTPRLGLLADEDVSDPIGGDLDVYRNCADQIETAVKRLIEGF